MNMCLYGSTGGGNGVASVPSSPYTLTRCKEGILAAILIDFLTEIGLILQGEVIHLIQKKKNMLEKLKLLKFNYSTPE